MKTLSTIIVAVSTAFLFACNADNADNPTNSAESPDTDSATESTTDLNAPEYNGAVVAPPADTTMMADTPAK